MCGFLPGTIMSRGMIQAQEAVTGGAFSSNAPGTPVSLVCIALSHGLPFLGKGLILRCSNTHYPCSLISLAALRGIPGSGVFPL